jgi:hypothetical protein
LEKSQLFWFEDILVFQMISTTICDFLNIAGTRNKMMIAL